MITPPSRHHRPTLQPLRCKPPQQFQLLFLVPARHQNQELLRDRSHRLRLAVQHFRGGGFPGGGEGIVVGRRHFQQALVQLLLRFGQGSEGVDGEEQLAGFFLGHVEDFHVHFHIGVHVAAEVAVDEFQATVG